MQGQKMREKQTRGLFLYVCGYCIVTKMKYASKDTAACKTRKTVLLKTPNFLISINITEQLRK